MKHIAKISGFKTIAIVTFKNYSLKSDLNELSYLDNILTGYPSH